MKKSLAIGDPISSAGRLAAGAKERGYELIEFRTFSKDSEYYQRSYDGSLFDSVYEYRGDDAQALHALKDAEHIMIGADSSVQFVERLNLFRGELENDPSKILARADKVEQARHFHAAGLPIVPQQYFDDLDSAMRYAMSRRFPQVLKPRASGGTNNVLLARNPVEFKACFLKIANARSLYDRPNGGALVMDYIDPELADEFVVDAVSCQGRHLLTDICSTRRPPLTGHRRCTERCALYHRRMHRPKRHSLSECSRLRATGKEHRMLNCGACPTAKTYRSKSGFGFQG